MTHSELRWVLLSSLAVILAAPFRDRGWLLTTYGASASLTHPLLAVGNLGPIHQQTRRIYRVALEEAQP